MPVARYRSPIDMVAAVSQWGEPHHQRICASLHGIRVIRIHAFTLSILHAQGGKGSLHRSVET